MFFFFFFQAEDGIRDFHVTGVQTCALPIWGAWQSLGSFNNITSIDCGAGGSPIVTATTGPSSPLHAAALRRGWQDAVQTQVVRFLAVMIGPVSHRDHDRGRAREGVRPEQLD